MKVPFRPKSATTGAKDRLTDDGILPIIPGHTLHRRIGVGGYGDVWLARTHNDGWRAVKIIRRDAFDDDRPFQRELRGVRHFEPVSRQHPGLVAVYEVELGPEGDWFWYSMELADEVGRTANVGHQILDPEGYEPRTLRSDLRARGPLAAPECFEIAVPILDCLAFLHAQGLVHRDVKPSNILFIAGRPKLSDPGLVTSLDETASLAGTQDYVPTEGAGTPGGDLFALGKTLYELATGRPPQDVAEMPTQLSKMSDRKNFLELAEIIGRACDPEPKRRYVAAAGMRADLELLREGRSVRQVRILQRRVRRLAMATAVVGTLAVLGLAAAAWQRAQYKRDQALHELVTQRQQERRAGWRDRLLESIRKTIPGPGDLVWRSQAVAALHGLDARLELSWIAQPAQSIAFNSTGDHAVVGGPDLPTRWVALAPERILVSGEQGALALTFDGQGRALELREGKNDELVVKKVDDAEPIARLTWPAAVERGSGADGLDLRDGRFHFSRQGSRVVGIRGGQLVVWNLPLGDVRWSRAAETSVYALDPDGQTLALLLSSGEILVCDTEGGGEFRLPASRKVSPRSLAFGRDPVLRRGASRPGWLLAAGDAGGMITIWDLSRRTIRIHLAGSQYEVSNLAFSADSTLLASGGRAEVRLWNLATGQAVLSDLGGNFHETLAFSPDGTRLASVTRTGFDPGEVQIWSLESGQSFQSFRGLASVVIRLALSPDNRRLAAVSSDWELGVWDLDSGRLLWAREIPEGFFADNVGLTFSTQSHRVACVTGTAAGLWDRETGQELRSWNLPPGITEALVFDAEGSLLSFRMEQEDVARDNPPREGGSVYRTGRLRNLLAPHISQLIQEFRDFPSSLGDAAFSPDGKTLTVAGPKTGSTVSLDGYVMAIDTKAGQKLWSVTMPLGSVTKPLGRSEAGARLTIDTSGTVVAAQFFLIGVTSVEAVMDLRTGARRPDLIFGASLAREGRFALRQGQPWIRSGSGLSLFEKGVPQLVLDQGLPTIGAPILSRDGSIVVWPHRDGTLHACRLDKVRAELDRYKVPW